MAWLIENREKLDFYPFMYDIPVESGKLNNL